MYPQCPHLFDIREFKFDEYLSESLTHKPEMKNEDPGGKASTSILNFVELREAHYIMIRMMEQLGLAKEVNRFHMNIGYTAMTIFHLCCKSYEAKVDRPKIDVKLLLLASLRISAVIHDVELRQDNYTKVFYELVTKKVPIGQSSQKYDLQSPAADSSSTPATMPGSPLVPGLNRNLQGTGLT